jgi:hypothetical protein
LWKLKESSTGSIREIAWQQATDIAVQGDYDADGKTDIAVWRDATGYWFIQKSSTNTLRQEQWGMSGDIPVPAPYRR